MVRASRGRDGRVVVQLRRDEAAVLAQVPALLDSVGQDEGDPAQRRLAPSARPDDAESDREFVRLAAAELESARNLDRGVFLRTLGRGSRRLELTVDEAEAWVRVVGDARLVIAARLGLFEPGVEDIDVVSVDDADEPLSPHMAMVHFFGYVQQALVEALLSTMPATAG